MADNKASAQNQPITDTLSRRDFIKISAASLTVANMAGTAGCRRHPPPPNCLRDVVLEKAAAFKQVFESSFLSTIPIRNRLIRSATTMGIADEQGRPTEALTQKYLELVHGGVGAIITGMVQIQQNGRIASPAALMFDRDEHIPYYRKITKGVHQHHTPIIMQIAHAGRQTRSVLTGKATVAPSPVRHLYFSETIPRTLTEPEIREIIENFIRAIQRAKAAGFDGIQLHGAHGYLLSDFLSPHSNNRSDQWGGSTENRFRILKEIFEGARKRVGDYPLLIKINAYDGKQGGMQLEEAVKVASLLQDVGCDAIEVSCGTTEDGFSILRGPEIPVEAMLEHSFRLKHKSSLSRAVLRRLLPLLLTKYEPTENYNVCAAQEIKSHIDIPVIVVGGIKKLDDIIRIIAGRRADYIAMSRPFIIEPDIVNRLRAEQQTSSSCISCSYCLVSSEDLPARCFYGSLDQ